MLPEPPFDEAAEPERLQAFIAELEADGFERVGPCEWSGPIRPSLIEGGHTDADRMTIHIRPSWPYLPPLIHVPGIAAWHADQERLCIWQAEDNSQRWVTIQGLYDRIGEWAADAQDGFAAVENARNPEIYWQEDCAKVIGLVDLEQLLGRERNDGAQGEFHFAEAVSADGRQSPAVVFDLDPGAFRSTTALPTSVPTHLQVRGRWFYRSSVPHPPRTFEELKGCLTENQRQRLEKDFQYRRTLMFGLLWHNQAGLVGTMLLAIIEGSERIYRLVILRPKGRDALLLRAGPDARTLQQKRVAILGVGAIGSHVAEQLARAGLGSLRLIDHDLLWPANLIRHAAPPGTPAATLKTVALQEHLGQYQWIKIDIPPQTLDGCVWTLSGLRDVLQGADLTVDATGHAGLAELVARVGRSMGRPFLSVALFRGGAVARVRRQAHEDDTPFLQRPHLDIYPGIPPLDDEAEYVGTETGCLARIHNAPPVSVAHAAVLAVEVAIDYLAGRHDQPDEIIEVIRPGDPPFDRQGRVRPEDLPVTIDISERAQDLLRAASRIAVPNETGGVLVGCIIDGRSVVAEVAEIRDDDASATRYRIPEERITEAVTEARERDPRLGYLGEWHSHLVPKGPSTLDIAAMLGVAQDSDSTNPLLLLVHPHASAPDDLRVYVTTPGGLKPASICTTGDLPIEDPMDAA